METLTTTTNHVALKKKMLDASIAKHQTVINDFRTSIREMMDSEGNINEEEFDLSQQEFNAEMLQQVNRIADQLKFANDEMVMLFNMIPTIGTIHQEVQLGAAVVTDKDVFFVSASIERFEIDGLKVFGLSVHSPLFKNMEGKKRGDIFTYRKDTYRILDVY